jgi:hypothetical protein
MILPSDVVELLGSYMDYPTRRSCLLAHKSLAPTMNTFVGQIWELREGQPFDKKIASLMKWKPRLHLLNLIISEALDVESLAKALLERLPSTVDIVIQCDECDAAITPLLTALSSHRKEKVVCFGYLQTFTAFVDVMDHCSRGWLAAGNIVIRNHVELDDDCIDRVKRLEKSWHVRPWTIPSVRFDPEAPAYVSVHEKDLMKKADAASSICNLLALCVKDISISIGAFPTLLSRVAHQVSSNGHLFNSVGGAEFMEDLSQNPNLRTLELSRWNSQIVLHQRELFQRLVKNGQVNLRLCNEAIKDPSLGNMILTTTCKIELCVKDAIGAFIARRAVDSLKARISPRRVKILYAGDAEGLADVPLATLAAKVVEEEDPAVCTYFDVSKPT